jgi:hypothetical protein
MTALGMSSKSARVCVCLCKCKVMQILARKFFVSFRRISCHPRRLVPNILFSTIAQLPSFRPDRPHHPMSINQPTIPPNTPHRFTIWPSPAKRHILHPKSPATPHLPTSLFHLRYLLSSHLSFSPRNSKHQLQHIVKTVTVPQRQPPLYAFRSVPPRPPRPIASKSTPPRPAPSLHHTRCLSHRPTSATPHPLPLVPYLLALAPCLSPLAPTVDVHPPPPPPLPLPIPRHLF